MSLTNKFFSILTIAISIIAFSVFTFAQDNKTTTTTTPDTATKPAWKDGKGKFGHDGTDGRHGGRGEFGMMELRGINLTDAQKEQIKAIHEANKPDPAVMEEARTLIKAKRDGTITADQQAR